jgi:hypothetical protein
MRTLRFVTLAVAFTVPGIALSTLGGCASDPSPSAPACVAVDRACAPAYEPTFDNVFTKTLQPSCALAGSSCHASAGHNGGLVLDDPETAYRLLMQNQRAIAKDPECSALTRRLESTDTAVMMPPGLPLAQAERCAIIQWMARGALR